jgi:hypothetical protein
MSRADTFSRRGIALSYPSRRSGSGGSDPRACGKEDNRSTLALDKKSLTTEYYCPYWVRRYLSCYLVE